MCYVLQVLVHYEQLPAQAPHKQRRCTQVPPAPWESAEEGLRLWRCLRGCRCLPWECASSRASQSILHQSINQSHISSIVLGVSKDLLEFVSPWLPILG